MSIGQPDPSNHHSSDAVLWSALKAGNTEALGALYDRHASLVYGLAIKVLGSAQEAEDLTQDIFLSLVQQSSYNPSRGSLRTYLGIVTRSRAIDLLRSRKTSRNVVDRLKPGASSSTSADAPSDFAFQQEQTQMMQQALAELSKEQRQVLHMAYYEGLTQATISERLSLPLGTVKARARRGLLKLRQILYKAGE
ncbi:MAG: sigma-70 family RNA polymerase sigma factor [Cyanobacteria bacterium P01_H01_bin.119]